MGKQQSSNYKDPVDWAVTQLRAGLLASVLPARLMAEFGLTRGQARWVAARALKRKVEDHGKATENPRPSRSSN